MNNPAPTIFHKIECFTICVKLQAINYTLCYLLVFVISSGHFFTQLVNYLMNC